MNRHYDRYLTKKYPLLYKHRHSDPTYSNMGWGFECGDGWFELLNSLSFALENLCDYFKIDITVTQVKEKYGTLRFYYFSHGNDESHHNKRAWRLIDGLVSIAEDASHHTCEICGRWGEVRNTDWIQTLCDEHYKETRNAR